MDPLIRVSFQNVASKILALGIGDEKLLKSFNRDAPVAVDIAAAKLQVEMMPIVIVCDRSQYPRFYPHPLHDLISL